MITFALTDIVMWLAGPALALAYAIRHHIKKDDEQHTDILNKQAEMNKKLDKLGAHLGVEL